MVKATGARSDFTLVVREIRRPDVDYHLNVCWWTTVRALKESLSSSTGEHINGHHLYFESGTELNGDSTLHDLGIRKSGISFSLLLDTQIQDQSESETGFISPFNTSHVDEKTADMLEAVKGGSGAYKTGRGRRRYCGGVFHEASQRPTHGSFQAAR